MALTDVTRRSGASPIALAAIVLGATVRGGQLSPEPVVATKPTSLRDEEPIAPGQVTQHLHICQPLVPGGKVANGTCAP
jgi:ABC-type hemin transport system substrate-binding protein